MSRVTSPVARLKGKARRRMTPESFSGAAATWLTRVCLPAVVVARARIHCGAGRLALPQRLRGRGLGWQDVQGMEPRLGGLGPRPLCTRRRAAAPACAWTGRSSVGRNGYPPPATFDCVAAMVIIHDLDRNPGVSSIWGLLDTVSTVDLCLSQTTQVLGSHQRTFPYWIKFDRGRTCAHSHGQLRP